MNFPHLHLLLNHWPIIGIFIAFGLFLLSLLERNKDLRRASLIIYAAIGLITIPAFLSGIGAQAVLKNNPAVSMSLMQRHEGAALLTMALMLATGALALGGLWQGHRIGRQTNNNTWALLIFSILAIVMVIRTGNTGGDINHVEIRDNPTANAPVVEGAFGTFVHHFEPNPVKFGGYMAYSKWCTAILMDLHFIGLALLIGTVGVLDARILGFAKNIPLAALHRFVPWALVGFGINVVTGLGTYMGSPGIYNFDGPFWLKMLCLLLLGANVAVFYLFGIFDGIEHLGPGQEATISAKLIAASSLILWVAVIVFGRYIQAYEGSIPIPGVN